MRRFEALIFDLGDTLIEYEGLPLSWEEYYPAALKCLSRQCNHQANDQAVAEACQILKRYNTRLYPRVEEVRFEEIVSELIAALGCERPISDKAAAQAFFSFFRQRLRCFADAAVCLRKAKLAQQKVAVFTDVPYGMPHELVRQDVQAAGLEDLVDVLVTSTQAGFRKPDPRSLGFVLDRLGVAADSAVYVGNERKDIEVALAVGCESILIDRGGGCPKWGQHRTISSLLEL
jgi:putative hydrolase of the HAD superfamily